MKGPSGRAKFAIRRTWECPVCQRRQQTGGNVVTLPCTCTLPGEAGHPWMRLVDEPASSPRSIKPLQPVSDMPGDVNS
jgi:hypothetical protein